MDEVIPEKVETKPVDIIIEIPTQAYFISGIRDFVLNLTKNMTGFSEQWAFRFQAVTDELCNNAIEHGSSTGQKIRITLISVQGEFLEVIVEDTGSAENEKLTPEQLTALFRERRQMPADQFLGFRGRGLPKIVGEWTDEVEFTQSDLGGIKVRVKKYLRAEEDAVLSQKKDDPSHLVLS